MSKERKLVVDLSTRRIEAKNDDGTMDRWRVDTVRQASRAYGRAWAIVFLDAARLMAKQRLRPAESQVLWWCVAELHPKEWTLARHDLIGREIGMTRSAVTKAIGGLAALGLIERGDSSMLRLSIGLAWQGTAQAYQKQRRGRSGQIDAMREALRANTVAGTEVVGGKMWRIAEDGEPTAPREARPGAGRGGDARAIREIIDRMGFDGDGGSDGD